jgi:hypothetical protein
MQARSNRLTKFRIALQEYDFDIEYVKGKDNAAADALSRIRSEDLELVNITTRSMTKEKTVKEEELTTKIEEKEEKRQNSLETGSDQPNLIELLKNPQGMVEINFFDRLAEV